MYSIHHEWCIYVLNNITIPQIGVWKYNCKLSDLHINLIKAKRIGLYFWWRRKKIIATFFMCLNRNRYNQGPIIVRNLISAVKIIHISKCP